MGQRGRWKRGDLIKNPYRVLYQFGGILVKPLVRISR
jgi:hypothetical protein